MSPTRPLLSRSCSTFVLAIALAGCGSSAPQKADAPSVEQRLSDLERRVEKLEARPAVEPPLRSKVEIESQIKALEAERAKLLARYLPQHPEIRDIDRQLAILNSQLKMLE